MRQNVSSLQLKFDSRGFSIVILFGVHCSFASGDITYFVCDVTSQYDLIEEKIFVQELLELCHHPDMFGNHKHYDREYTIFLICHMT